jgi:hypothetical protein
MDYRVYVSSNALLSFIKFLIDNQLTTSWNTYHFGSYLDDNEITYYYSISFCSDEEHHVIGLFKDSDLYAENMYVDSQAPLTNDIIAF